jgi:hypothetical protein
VVPSLRLVVPRSEAFAPEVAVGAPLDVSGGHAAAQAPVHVLVVPESCVNRYNVRRCESTRIVPRAVLAVPILVGGVVFGVVVAVEDGFDDDVAAVAPPPPHAAMASGASASPAAVATIAIGLDGKVMLAPLHLGKSGLGPRHK